MNNYMWRKSFIALAVVALAVPFVSMQSASALTISPIVIEYDVDPGQTIVGTFRAQNEGADTESYYPIVQDFTAGDSAGTPKFSDVSDGRSMAGWVKFDEAQITLPAGAGNLVHYRISVPEKASPGGYFAGFLLSTSPPNVKGGISVGAATGPLVLLNVSGGVIEKGSLQGFSVKSEGTSLPAEFAMDFKNEGTVHVKPVGVIRITNLFGGTSAVIPVNAEGGNVLPDSNRVFSATWEKEHLGDKASEFSREWNNFALGPYTATLVMNYGDTDQVVSEQVSFWVMPWMMIVLFIILLVILALLVLQYNKWIVAQAQRSGHR